MSNHLHIFTICNKIYRNAFFTQLFSLRRSHKIGWHFIRDYEWKGQRKLKEGEKERVWTKILSKMKENPNWMGMRILATLLRQQQLLRWVCVCAEENCGRKSISYDREMKWVGGIRWYFNCEQWNKQQQQHSALYMATRKLKEITKTTRKKWFKAQQKQQKLT